MDRIQRKTAIIGGLYAWSAICMATALSRNFRHLLLFRAAEGCGETFYYPATVSLISDYHGRQTRSRALSFLVTSVYVGTIGGGFFAGLIGHCYGWRWSFIVFGGLGILLGLVLHRYLLEPRRGAAEGLERAIKAETKLPAAQAIGVFAGAPFVALCGITQSVAWLVVALAGWGFFKGMYDANIFASPFDVIPPEARGAMAGLMNCVGWLGGGGTAPIVVGLIAQRSSLGFAIAITSVVYCLAGVLLLVCMGLFVERDSYLTRVSQTSET